MIPPLKNPVVIELTVDEAQVASLYIKMRGGTRTGLAIDRLHASNPTPRLIVSTAYAIERIWQDMQESDEPLTDAYLASSLGSIKAIDRSVLRAIYQRIVAVSPVVKVVYEGSCVEARRPRTRVEVLMLRELPL